ncbi:MAG: DNA polymerase III subunit delta [Anaerolineae bacterium]
MIYFIFGSDDFTTGEDVRRLRERLAATDPAAEMNTNMIDGRSATTNTIRAAADSLPFMADRRLVIVSGMLERCSPRIKGGKALAESLLEYLPSVPETTRLVFQDGALSPKNPVVAWAQKQPTARGRADADGGRCGGKGRGQGGGLSGLEVVVRKHESPKAVRLPGWLAKRAEDSGGRIEPAAAIALADALTRDGSVDMRHASSELEKLLTYAGDRPVTAEDVEAIITPVSLDSVFRFVDALAARNGPEASTQLHKFLEDGEHPLRLFALISRQFRMITRAKLMHEAGLSQREVQSRLHVAPFVARKVTGQAQRFSGTALRSALVRLVEFEEAIKTGRINPVLALDLFVAEQCQISHGTSRRRSSRSRS